MRRCGKIVAAFFTTLAVSADQSWPSPTMLLQVLQKQVKDAEDKGEPDKGMTSLVEDSRWKICEDDVQDPSCQAIKFEAIQWFMDANKRVSNDLEERQEELEDVEKDMKKNEGNLEDMKESLEGDGSSLGIVKKMKQVTDGINEMKTVSTGKSREFKTFLDGKERNIVDSLTSMENASDAKLNELGEAVNNEIKEESFEQDKEMDKTDKEFVEQMQGVETQAKANNSQMEKAVESEGEEINEFKISSGNELGEVDRNLDGAIDEAQQMGNKNKQKLRSLKINLKGKVDGTVKKMKKRLSDMLDKTTRKFKTSVAQIVGTASEEVKNVEEKEEATAKKENAAYDREIDNLGKEIEREEENGDGKLRVASTSLNTKLTSLQDEQMKADVDAEKTAEDNEASLEDAEMYAKEGSEQRVMETLAAKKEVDQASINLSKDVSSADTKLGKQVVKQLDDAASDVESLEQEANREVHACGVRVVSKVRTAKRIAVHTATHASERIASAGKSLKTMGKVVGDLIRTAGKTEDERVSEVGKNASEEDMELSKAAADVEKEAQRGNLELQKDTTRYLNKQGEFVSDDLKKKIEKISKENAALEERADIDEGARSREINYVTDATSFVDEELHSQKEEIENVQKEVDPLKKNHLDEIEALKNETLLSQDLLKQSSEEAAQKAQADANEKYEEEKLELSKKESTFSDEFGKAMTAATEGTRKSYQNLSSDVMNMREATVDANVRIDKADKEVSEVARKTESQVAEMESEMHMNASQKSETIKEIVGKALEKSDEIIEEGEKKSNERVEKQSEEMLGRLNVGYEKAKEGLQELQDRVVELTKTNLKTKGEALTVSKEANVRADSLNSRLASYHSEMSKLSENENSRLNAFRTKIQTWAVTSEEDVFKALSSLREELRKIPQLTGDKIGEVQDALKVSKEGMREYLANFQKAVDKYRETEYSFRNEQSIRLMSVLLGVNKAILVGEDGLLTKLLSGGLFTTMSSKNLSIILSEMVKMMFLIKNENAKNNSEVNIDLDSLKNNSNSLYAFLKAALELQYSNITSDLLKSENSNLPKLKQMESHYQRNLKILGLSLNGAMGNLDKDRSEADYELGRDKKDVFAIGSLIQSLSLQSKIELKKLLTRIHSGELSFEEVLRHITENSNLSISNLNEIIAGFRGVTDSYIVKTRKGFEEVDREIDSFTQEIKAYVDNSAAEVSNEAHSLQTMVSHGVTLEHDLEEKADAFEATLTQILNQAQQNKSDMEEHQQDVAHRVNAEVSTNVQHFVSMQKEAGREISGWVKTNDEELEGFLRMLKRDVAAAKLSASFLHENSNRSLNKVLKP